MKLEKAADEKTKSSRGAARLGLALGAFPAPGAGGCEPASSVCGLILFNEEPGLETWARLLWVTQRQTALECLRLAPGRLVNVTVLACPRVAASACVTCHKPQGCGTRS